ncbi:MAG: hypothetical protein QM493_02150 [Sulfurovum sp.]
MKKILFTLLITLSTLSASCQIPNNIRGLLEKSSLHSLKKHSDIRKNFNALKYLCVDVITFKEGKYKWRMLLVTNPKQQKGAFWFLPHDDENTAFDSAVYGTLKYGGGFLAVMANNNRYFKGQDPNRNFGNSKATAKICRKQHYPAPKYSKIVFDIIDTYRDRRYPYMALHNNKNGHRGNGGSGGVSILKSSRIVKSYPAFDNITKRDRGLRDEDSLVYIAGFSKTPNRTKLNNLLREGLNTKYEIIRKSHNDCSLSNYVVLNKKTTNYYNIESQHRDLKTQKLMIDKIMRLIK